MNRLNAATHTDRCLRSDAPITPSFMALSFAHGDLRAALDRARRLSSSQARCSCISASSRRARSSGEFIGAPLFGRRWRRSGLRFLERPREYFEVEFQAVEEPRHRAYFA